MQELYRIPVNECFKEGYPHLRHANGVVMPFFFFYIVQARVNLARYPDAHRIPYGRIGRAEEGFDAGGIRGGSKRNTEGEPGNQ